MQSAGRKKPIVDLKKKGQGRVQVARPQAPVNVPVVPRRRPERNPRTRGSHRLRRQGVSAPNMRLHLERLKNLKGRGRGRVLVIVACGPSIQEADLSALRTHPKIDTMSINKPDPRVWPTTFWAFLDPSQYNRNQDIHARYDGVVINSSSINAPHRNQILIKTRQGKGFSRDLTVGGYIGRSTTYFSMQMALYMLYDRVYVFGADMGKVDGRLHFYGVNPDVSPENRIQRFAREAEHYQYAAGLLSESERKRFYFCSTYNRFKFVDSFNSRDHRTVAPEILAYADSLAA